MSVVDKVRSFAETRCRDEEVVPCGFTYGDMRELLTALSEPTDAGPKHRRDARWVRGAHSCADGARKEPV